MNDLYYKPSGKVSPSSIIYFILASLTLIPLLALAYTYLVWYIPFIYLNILLTAGFGFGVALSITFLVIHLGKVRNPMVAALFAVLGGLVAMYINWAIWIDLVINAGESYGNSRIGITASNVELTQVWDLLLNPGLMKEFAGRINEVGTWGLRSSTVSGTFLSIIWVIEALIVIVISVFTALGRAGQPYCEEDNKWFKDTALPAFNFIDNASEMKDQLESSNPNVFSNLSLASNPSADSHSVFTIYTSEKGQNYLSIENKRATLTKKNEIEFDEDEFVEYISISPELLEVLAQVKLPEKEPVAENPTE